MKWRCWAYIARFGLTLSLLSPRWSHGARGVDRAIRRLASVRVVGGVPLAAGGPRSIGDRVVRFAEEVVGQDLDARIAGITTHLNEVGHDPFGFDPETSRYALAVAALLHRRYFRTQVFGDQPGPSGQGAHRGQSLGPVASSTR